MKQKHDRDCRSRELGAPDPGCAQCVQNERDIRALHVAGARRADLEVAARKGKLRPEYKAELQRLQEI